MLNALDIEQLGLFGGDLIDEDPNFLTRQVVTYIGNKRGLLSEISRGIEKVKSRLRKKKLRAFDVFSGSGVVSRLLKGHCSYLSCNDLENYSNILSHCYLTNRSTVDFRELGEIVLDLNASVLHEGHEIGFIEELYAPRDELNITKEDRVFYTRENARRIDTYRKMIERYPPNIRTLLLGPLLSEASVHANTAGVFKGFYKNRNTQIGQFGGTGSDALLRILGKIELEVPVLSRFECEIDIRHGDSNEVAGKIKNLDLAYLDPPYNQHPYGSNYFMLNLIVDYIRPTEISGVSGIPSDWKRSAYNVRAKSFSSFKQLLESLDARFLLISFNNEGFISPEEMRDHLQTLGHLEVIEKQYNAFRGSRSFANRPIHVTEQLFILERK
ncbi:MAG: DNA adenine methylase [Lysobacterales bacterium]